MNPIILDDAQMLKLDLNGKYVSILQNLQDKNLKIRVLKNESLEHCEEDVIVVLGDIHLTDVKCNTLIAFGDKLECVDVSINDNVFVNVGSLVIKTSESKNIKLPSQGVVFVDKYSLFLIKNDLSEVSCNDRRQYFIWWYVTKFIGGIDFLSYVKEKAEDISDVKYDYQTILGIFCEICTSYDYFVRKLGRLLMKFSTDESLKNLEDNKLHGFVVK